MIRLSCSILVAMCLLASPAFAAAKKASSGLKKVCPNILAANSSNSVYKTNAPVRACAAHTCPIKFFRQEPTLIMKQRVNLSTVNVYSASGAVIGRCPWASAHGYAGGRYRCTMNTRSLTSAALKTSKSPSLYFPIKGNRCMRVPNGNSCIGSAHC